MDEETEDRQQLICLLSLVVTLLLCERSNPYIQVDLKRGAGIIAILLLLLLLGNRYLLCWGSKHY